MKILLDIYGTLLASDDHDNVIPMRTGLEILAQQGKIITISDCPTSSVKADLRQMYENVSMYRRIINPLDHISDFIHMHENPKEIHLYAQPEDLVIGDSEKDIQGAIQANCKYLKVPEFRGGSNEKDLWKLVKHNF
jgi:hypothetical protein